MPIFRLTLAYDGTEFAGSQVQPGARTVQGELDAALRELGGRGRSTFAGRTDRGVHAAGQVVAADLAHWGAGADALARALNVRVPSDMAILDAAACDTAFNPRFDAVWREYRYWIAPGAVDPFLRRTSWTPRARIDAEAVNAAAGFLVGTHDFASFAGGGEGVPWSDRAARKRGSVRTVFRCECRNTALHARPGCLARGEAIELRAAADGFLPRMVRNIVGALVEVGQGRQRPEWIADVLAARDRRSGSVLAPAQGLTLWRVGFDGDDLEDW